MHHFFILSFILFVTLRNLWLRLRLFFWLDGGAWKALLVAIAATTPSGQLALE